MTILAVDPWWFWLTSALIQVWLRGDPPTNHLIRCNPTKSELHMQTYVKCKLYCIDWIFKIVSFIFKHLHGLAPTYLDDLLILVPPGTQVSRSVFVVLFVVESAPPSRRACWLTAHHQKSLQNFGFLTLHERLHFIVSEFYCPLLLIFLSILTHFMWCSDFWINIIIMYKRQGKVPSGGWV